VAIMVVSTTKGEKGRTVANKVAGVFCGPKKSREEGDKSE